jgi:hypothetical protein
MASFEPARAPRRGRMLGLRSEDYGPSLCNMSQEAPTWAQTLGRMAAFGVRTATGAIRYRDSRHVDDDGQGEEGGCRFWFAAPDSWRVEDQDGVRHVQDLDWTYLRDHDGRMQRMQTPTMAWSTFGHPATLIGSPHDRVERFTRADDFSVPMGPPVSVEVAGRPCWEFTLAPPARKPHPLRIAVDDATGTVLRLEVTELDGYVTVTEFHPDVQLDPALFTWDGEVATDHEDELAAMQQINEWLEQQALPVPRWWPAGMGYSTRQGDPQTGAFSVDLEVPGFRSLARWPVGGEPPRYWSQNTDGRHVHEWSDGTWQWSLVVDEPLTNEELTRVVESIPRE